MIRTTLNNAGHSEYGSVPLEFPIRSDEYDYTIGLLTELGIGKVREQDCTVSELNSWYAVLKPLESQSVNVDELDYLAKRLDGFTEYEAAQFQSMASKMRISDIRDFINLTFSCQQATVITNFSDLNQAGRDHILTTRGGCVPASELEKIDAKAEALKLILNGTGSVTPYGVAYDNGMELKQLYEGQHFPAYLYEPCLLAIEITPPKEQPPTHSDYLYLPASDQQLARTLERAGATCAADERMRIELNGLPPKVSETINLQQESLAEVNKMCQAIMQLSEPERQKLDAAVLMAQPTWASEIRQLAINLEQFEYVANVQTLEEYGKYMIQQSGHFEYDPNLEDFYDYERYADQKITAEDGRFNECGYISYQGSLTLDELMQGDPVEQDFHMAL